MEALIIKAFIAVVALYCAMYAGLALYFKYRNKEWFKWNQNYMIYYAILKIF